MCNIGAYAGRMWCHCRMVYLPMSYLYGKRFVGPINSMVLSLRKELYTLPYHLIDWDRSRNLCHKVSFPKIIMQQYYCQINPNMCVCIYIITITIITSNLHFLKK